MYLLTEIINLQFDCHQFNIYTHYNNKYVNFYYCLQVLSKEHGDESKFFNITKLFLLVY